MDTDITGLLRRRKRNAERKTRFTVMLELLCFQWQKIRQQILPNAVSMMQQNKPCGPQWGRHTMPRPLQQATQTATRIAFSWES